MQTEIHGGKILVFGDLHISDVFTGRHKDYLSNCFGILHDIEKRVEMEKPSAVVFAGDIVGWSETNIRNREILSMFLRFWKRLNETCPVFAVRGNHDMKGYPDFNLLEDLGVLRTPKVIDYYAENGKKLIRFHLVSYGTEHDKLDIDESANNVVIGHNNYMISGCTTWYKAGDGIELSELENYCGVDIVVSGHIHAPSPELYKTTMRDDSECGLMYLGCPTRPQKETYDACWIMSFQEENIGGNVEADMSTILWELKPHEELYFSDEEVIDEISEEELEDIERKEKLTEVLSDIMKYRMLGGDPMQQIDSIPNASEKAKNLAKQYLGIVINN